MTTRSAVEPNSFRMRTACFDSASIERSSGVFLSSASPVQLTNAVGITSVDRAAAVEQPRRARRIPRRVAARFEGGAHAARREARRVGLALDQFLAAELGDRLAVAGRRQKRVVLLGRDAGERLEPVRVVRGAVLDRPILHRRGDGVGDRGVERLAVRDRPAQRLVRGLRQPRLLFGVVEHEAAEPIARAGLQRRGSLALLAFCNRPVANRTNRIAEHCGTHRVPLFDLLSSFFYRKSALAVCYRSHRSTHFIAVGRTNGALSAPTPSHGRRMTTT